MSIVLRLWVLLADVNINVYLSYFLNSSSERHIRIIKPSFGKRANDYTDALVRCAKNQVEVVEEPAGKALQMLFGEQELSGSEMSLNESTVEEAPLLWWFDELEYGIGQRPVSAERKRQCRPGHPIESPLGRASNNSIGSARIYVKGDAKP